ncbi:hypothetical protein BN1723_016196, partial [Verticillium longisporum]
LDLRW